MSQALRDIFVERQRQIGKGYDAAHDDQEVDGRITRAAIAYLLATLDLVCEGQDVYPWTNCPEWETGKHREYLVTAGALIAAEIERWDRLRAKSTAERDGTPAL